jgi:deoxyribonuclease-4
VTPAAVSRHRPTADFLFGTVGIPISTPRSPGGTVGGVRETARRRLTALELAWVQSVRISEARCAEIRENASASIACSACPVLHQLNAGQEGWPKGRKRLMDAAHAESGATDIIFHPGSYFGRTPSEVLPWRSRLKVRPGAPQPGQPRDPPAGDDGQRAPARISGRHAAAVRRNPGVQPCWTSPTCAARERFGQLLQWLRISLVAERIGPQALQTLHIHLSGIEYGRRAERHLPLKKADLRYRDLLRALHDVGASGRILCESPLMEKDALVLQRAWIRLAKART